MAPSAALGAEAVMFHLQDIRIDGFPKNLSHLRKRYVTVRIDQGEVWKYRKLGISKDALVWTELGDHRRFEALLTSTFELKLFEAPLVGEKGKEIGTISQTIQSLIDSPYSRSLSLKATTQKTPLSIRIIIVEDQPRPPIRKFASGDADNHEADLGKVVADTQDALSAMRRPRALPRLDKAIDGRQATSDDFDFNTWKPLLRTLNGFMILMDGVAEIHPYARMAWSVVSMAYKIYKNQKDRDDAVNDLVDKMKEAYDIIIAGSSLKDLASRIGIIRAEEVQQAVERHEEVLQRLSMQTVECGHFIATYARDRNFFMRAGQQVLLNPQSIIDRLSTSFYNLQQAFLGQAAVSTEIIVLRALQTVHKIEMTIDLSGLTKAYVEGAGCNSEKQCLAGTRTAMLDELCEWINCTDDDSPRIRLLLGQAGTGKSTIAHTVACRFRQMKRLGAAFCFNSSSARQSQHAFATLAVDLAAFDPAFKATLWHTVGQDLADQTTSDLMRQFDNFILKPSQGVVGIGSIFVLIDGLDEIGDIRARAPLLRILSNHLRKLPPVFRVLLTARPEPDIVAYFDKPESGCIIQFLNLTQDDRSLQNDIQLFIRTELTKPELRIRDLEESNYGRLAELSEGLFQWARVACNYIAGDGRWRERPKRRYEALLGNSERAQNEDTQANILDTLYLLVLPRLILVDDSEPREKFKLAMGMVLNTIEPLTMEALEVLARHIPGLFRDDLIDLLPHLASFLSGVSLRHVGVRPLHSSFRDFLSSSCRAKEFYIGDASIHQTNLAMACLRVLGRELHFNMGKLQSSYQLNRDVPDLNKYTGDSISLQLSYASRFWAQHFKTKSGFAPDLIEDVKRLLEINFLFWLEVLSLLGAVNSAAWALSIMIPVLQVSDVKLADLATDELRFVRNLARPISESAAHIYVSALVNTPKGSPMQKHYFAQYPQIAQICAGRWENWPALHNTLRGHSDWVECVALSPDGKRIVSGSGDATVRIWDAETGEPIGAPLEGHGAWVSSVAFSPDGKRIVSAAYDSTIRIWDAGTGNSIVGHLEVHGDNVRSVAFSPNGKRIVSGGVASTIRMWDADTVKPVGIPLSGHSDRVNSVAYSPDGERIVSGSDDNTIRIWDVETGEAVGSPLDGHRHRVNSVTFSPNGKWIASGSGDMTVRIWDVEAGEPVGPPLEGHDGSVTSVAFSPDGKRVASGSDDTTLRIWDAGAGVPLGAALDGHSGSVYSVAFLPDGKRVVTGSDDRTIRTWDTEAGDLVRVPLEGHDGAVFSVVFSPDGKQIASGSHDNSIRIWDAETGKPLGGPLKGHVHNVYSVAFSPDGTRVVSGSGDNTIRIWDVALGKPVGGPMEGHTGWVNSVTFSPDGKRIISGSDDSTVRIWDTETGQSLGSVLEGHAGSVNSVAFSSDGKRIVAGSDDTTIRMWDAEMGKPLGATPERYGDAIYSVVCSPDNKWIASGSEKGTIRIWDASSLEPVQVEFKGHATSVLSVAFSPDSRRIVSGSGDRTVRIWDAQTGGLCHAPLDGHSRLVRSVAFSPDGQRIVSCSYDKTIRIWELGIGVPVETRLDSESHSEEHVEPVFQKDQNQMKSSTNNPAIRTTNLLAPTSELCFCRDPHHHLSQPYLSADGSPVRVTIHHDTGWIICNQSDYLLWLPPQQLRYLCTPMCALVIPTSRMLSLDTSRFAHGARWTSCSEPNS